MFQYTREFIINEDVAVNADKEKNIVSIEGIASYKVGSDGAGMNRICELVEVPFKKSTPPTIDIPFTTDATADQKIVIRLELYRATEASYANNLHAKMSKMFQFEIPAGYTIEEAKDLIKDTLRYSDHEYFAKDGIVVSGANIQLVGVDGSQRVSAEVFKSTGIDVKHEAQWERISKVERVDGVIGSGTYELMLHNHRLPTMENTNYFSPNKYFMPIPGAEYKLVEFVYNSGIRNIGGQGVVGSYERSMTKHRFWVNTKATLTNFDKAVAILKANAVSADIPAAVSELSTSRARKTAE